MTKLAYRSYICDDCGYSSEEEPGVYYCPKCGNKMRAAKSSYYGGDFSAGAGKWLIYVIVVIVLYPICFATFGFIIGTIVFIILFLVIRYFLNSRIRNKSKRIK